MKMKKRYLSLCLAGCMVLSMAACGSTSSGSEDPGAQSAPVVSSAIVKEQEKELNIAVVVNTLNSEYWNFVAAGAEGYQADHPNVTVKVMGPPSQTAYDEQMNMVETVLNSNEYDGMVISALQAETVAHMLEEDCTIPVVAMNTPLESDKVLSFVGTGNEAAAYEGGMAAVEAAKAAGWEDLTAIVIAGTQGDPAGEERLNGFINGAKDAGATILTAETQYTDWAADRAVTSMEAILQNHPEGVAMILSCADDMAMAAARTAEGYAEYENTVFCGFDGNINACESILAGELTMSVAQDPYGMGYKAVEACVQAIDGEELPDFIDTGCEMIDASNAKAQMDTLNSYLK